MNKNFNDLVVLFKDNVSNYNISEFTHYIELMIIEYIKDNNALDYLSNIKLSSKYDHWFVYNKASKEIILNIPLIIKKYIKDNNIDNLEIKEIQDIVIGILLNIYRSAAIIKVYSIADRDDSLVSQILNDSITNSSVNADIFNEHHNIFPQEHMAGVEASFSIVKYLNHNNIHFLDYMKFESLIQGYIVQGDRVFSPFEEYERLNNKDKFIFNPNIKIDKLDKLSLGLPIDIILYNDCLKEYKLRK